MTLNIDFNSPCGPVKALHGVNNSPHTLGDPIPSFAEAGIPYVRLHDTKGAYGGTYFVDVPNIFPDFDADVDKPESYDFTFTDCYLKGLAASGCRIFYRLGVTIENYAHIKAYRINPPKDNLKWAKICEHIIRHYNEGWAGGMHLDIEYWEIWNEPEGIGMMWTGTKEQFFDFYGVVATYLKKVFPHLKIGGYASVGFYDITRDLKAENRMFLKHGVEYLDYFLKEILQGKAPAPDFFSWHLYTERPWEFAQHARYVEEQFKKAGLKTPENIVNEWHCIPKKPIHDNCKFSDIKEAPGAAGTAAAIIHMQYSPVNLAMYYQAIPNSMYCGLYYFPTEKTTKNYYALLAFNELYKLKTAFKTTSADQHTVACAASDGRKAAVYAANFTPESRQVRLNISGFDFSRPVCTLIDENHCFEKANGILKDNILEMTPYSVILLQAEKD